MKFPWFKRTGIIYYPSNLAGWIIGVASVTFAIYKFIDIDGRSHSVSDTLINFVFNLIIIGVAYTTIAAFASRKWIK